MTDRRSNEHVQTQNLFKFYCLLSILVSSTSSDSCVTMASSSPSREQNENQKDDGMNTFNDSYWNSTNSVLMHPGNVLLLTSIPFFAGAYMGYKIPIESIEDMMSPPGESSSKSPSSSSSTVKGLSTSATRTSLSSSTSSSITASAEEALAAAEITTDEARAIASRMAVRAFRIATLEQLQHFLESEHLDFILVATDQ